MTGDLRYLYLTIVIVFLFTAGVFGFVYIGPVIVAIIGSAGVGGLVAWLLTTFKKPADPLRIAPMYFLTLAALMVHITEEYITDFPLKMSQTFSITFAEPVFVVAIAMVGFVFWILGGVSLLYRNPLGNYVCWFLFIGMIFAELTHFVFPIVEGGPYHYFSGMWTALLPLIPAAFGMRRLIVDSRDSKS
ncbi:MAG: hypothetical protein V3R60_04220 [Acidobacteriota bacterium]